MRTKNLWTLYVDFLVQIIGFVCTRTSPWAGERQRWVCLHALVQCGHSQKLPLVNAEFGDVFICFHVLRRPLLDSCPWVEVEHLMKKTGDLNRPTT